MNECDALHQTYMNLAMILIPTLLAFSDTNLLIAVVCGYGLLMGMIFVQAFFERRSRWIQTVKRMHASQNQNASFQGSDLSRLYDEVMSLQSEASEADARIRALEEQVVVLQQIVVEQASLNLGESNDPTEVDMVETAAEPVFSIYRPWQEKYGTEQVTMDPSYGIVFTESPESADDLTQIWGIGAVNQERLNEHGVYRFEQIVDWDEDHIANFNDLLGFKGRIEREDWVGQAESLANPSIESERHAA